MGDDVEEAETLRDPIARPQLHARPSGARSSTDAGPRGRGGRAASRSRIDFEAWLARTGCAGDDAARVARAARPTAIADGTADARPKIALRARKAQPDGDHRRQRHAARRPGPDRLARAASTASATAPTARTSSPASRPARAARTSRASRSSTPSPRPSREHGREHDDDLRAGAASPPTRSTRRSTPASSTVICITEGVPAHEMLRDLQLHPRRGRDDDRAELPRRALAGQGERRDHPGRDLHARARSASSRAPAR